MNKPYTLHLGDCLETLRTLPDNSVDSIVCDPPYGLNKEPDMAEVLRHWLAGDDYQHKGGGFMGKSWDSFVPGPSVWRECLRVLKPGGHLLAFFGTRTQDIGTLAIRLAGFEIRDSISWVYGSGFPKSLDVSKAIAKRAGGDVTARDAVAFMRTRREELGLSRIEFERLIFGRSDGNVRNWEDGISLPRPGLWPEIKRAMALDSTPFDADMERGDCEIGREGGSYGYQKNGERWGNERVLRSPTTEAARQWQGWGTALKPALEPITVARKPLVGTVAQNVLAHGTGALNIDGCRVGTESTVRVVSRAFGSLHDGREKQGGEAGTYGSTAGRWPANLIHDGSDEVVALFPDTGVSAGGGGTKAPGKNGIYGDFKGHEYGKTLGFGDSGSAARFFYAAKASRKDRNEGLTDPGPQFKRGTTLRQVENTDTKGNTHPTVKPTDLMAYLCRLVTPPGGVVLDPFMGSGSTGKAAMREGFRFIGCELSPEYLAIAEARISHECEKRNSCSAPEAAPEQVDLFAEAAE